jgi:dihydrofolate reductase
MSKLIYSSITSLDGYVADAEGRFEWGAPNEEVHAFVNDCERGIGTYLYGRRMYEVMTAWERPEEFGEMNSAMSDYVEIWQAAEKVVYSRTLEEPSSARTRIERDFDPEAVRALKESSDSDLSVGGPELAAEAMRARLVDEIQLFLAPIVVGDGTPALPDGVRMPLELLDERRFESGFAYLRYRVAA